MKKFIATKNASVLSNLKSVLSRGMIGRIKQSGEIYVGGNSVRMSQIVHVGEEITVILPVREKESVIPYFCEISIAYEDSDIIVLEKPAKMPTHTSKGNFETTLENAYCGMCKNRGEDVSAFTFHPITRLDSETSGLVLICKNPIATAKLSRDMQNGKIKKEYLALASGELKKDFEIELFMDRIEEGKPHRWQTEGGKYSKTIFKIKDKINGDTLLSVFPQTGRTHQIRVHLAHFGHAIVGDKLYQNGGILQGEKPTGRLMLFMHALQFENMQGEIVSLKSRFDISEVENGI